MKSAVRIIGVICICLLVTVGMQAQTATGTLHGQVLDPSGAVVTQATVTVSSASGQKTTVQTNAKGQYEVKLAPGKYNLRIQSKGFAAYDLADVNVTAGDTPGLDISLEVAVEQQQVTVEAENSSVNTEADSNANSIVLKGKDLDALSDDPDELQSDLEALAGPSAGPNGGQIYIDGFSNGTLPPKSSIREIRVNQNPFSAQYDRLGFGRVEVFTKPGTDKYHGQFMMNANHRIFNARNPFLDNAVGIPDYHSTMLMANFGGPINKKSSFFFNFHRRQMSDATIATGGWLPCAGFDLAPCSTFAPVSYGNAFATPQVRWEVSPRLDYQVTPNNTLTVRYEYEDSNRQNLGLGQFSLPSQLNVTSNGAEHNLQISDTQVINSTMINETRFQFVKDDSTQIDKSPLAGMAAITVMDAFSAGSSRGNSSNQQNHYEFQNYTSKVHGLHFLRFGGRVRVNTQNMNSWSNQYGTFTYTSPTAYYLVNYFAYLAGPNPDLAALRSTCQGWVSNGLTSVAGWSTDVRFPTTNGDCGIAQFTQTLGNPAASVSQTDAGLYAEDDWRIRPNVTLSYGLRFETQNNVDNRANFAPRLGIAWGLGKSKAPKTVLRAGFGMFYDRFGQGNVLQVIRSNMSNPQLNYLVREPNSIVSTDIVDPNSPPPSTVYSVSPDLRLPYTMQVATTLERQLTKTSKVTVSYVASRGLHQLAMENMSGTSLNRLYMYDSTGTFKQNQLMINSNYSIGRYVSLTGFYVYGHANSNTNGGFPMVPFDLKADWGRSSWDVRHRGMIMGSINLPRGFRLNPMINFSSSRPYTIYGPDDLNGDGIQNNDRPWFSNACTGLPMGTSSGNVYNTVLGCFSMVDTGLGRVPVNYAKGPSNFSTNLRISKTFGLGKKAESSANAGPGGGGFGGPGGPGGGRGHGGPGGGMPGGGFGRMMGGGGSGQRYSLTFSASARNLFNNVNAATPTGNLSSPTFAESTALAGGFGQPPSANRRIDFQVQFGF